MLFLRLCGVHKALIRNAIIREGFLKEPIGCSWGSLAERLYPLPIPSEKSLTFVQIGNISALGRTLLSLFSDYEEFLDLVHSDPARLDEASSQKTYRNLIRDTRKALKLPEKRKPNVDEVRLLKEMYGDKIGFELSNFIEEVEELGKDRVSEREIAVRHRSQKADVIVRRIDQLLQNDTHLAKLFNSVFNRLAVINDDLVAACIHGMCLEVPGYIFKAVKFHISIPSVSNEENYFPSFPIYISFHPRL